MTTVICLLPLILIIVSANGRIASDRIADVTNVINDEIKSTTVEEPSTTTAATAATATAATTQQQHENTEDIPNIIIPTTELPACGNLTEITDNTINSKENEPCASETKADNGTALILTPYLKENRIEEARNASRVDPDVFMGIESYSGYVTVNETFNSNVFFWYFPVENKPVNETPWIIWLQGGPGASSMTGLFDEIGPFFAEGGRLRRNPYTWHRNHSLLFIDNPVGTGFSFTTDEQGYVTDMETYSVHLYRAVQQVVQLFPELLVAPLFVAGESYAGKYVPALAHQIHTHRNEPDGRINLQGLMVGNGYVEPAMIAKMLKPYYYFGLLQTEQIEIIQPLLAAFQNDIATNNSTAAKNKWNHLVTVLLILTHQNHVYNFLRDDIPVGRFSSFLNTTQAKRALHVGDIKFSFVNLTVNAKLNGDFLSSAKSLYEELLDHYRVMVYCGQLDQMLPCALTSENYRTWRWNNSRAFAAAERMPFMFRNRLAGYHKSGGGLSEVVVRGAGHMAPQDAPAPLQHLVAHFTHNQPLPTRQQLFTADFLQAYIKNHTTVTTSSIHYL